MRRVVIAVVVLLGCGAAVQAANLVPNPSLEAGVASPYSWRCYPAAAGAWRAGDARFGQRCLAVDATSRPAAWRSASFPASARQGMRLSGWARAQGGRAWIEAHVSSLTGIAARRGCPTATFRTPVVRRAQWTYVAVDIPGAETRRAQRASIMCQATGGKAWFDGLRLTPLDVNILPNPALAPRVIDDKPVASGAPTGWNALPVTEERPLVVQAPNPAGPRALRLGEPGPSAAACYLVDLPPDTVSCGIEATVQTDGEVTCAIAWFGARGLIREQAYAIKGDQSAWAAPTDPPAPRGAERVRVSFALTRGTSALVQPLALIAVTRPQPPSQICVVFANQVGYEGNHAATAIVGSHDFPQRLEDARFHVVDDRGGEVFAGSLTPLGRMHESRSDDWGAYYWLADFSALARSGRFRVRAEVGAQRGTSHPFALAPGVLLKRTAELAYRHFYYQRCGGEVPGWHAPCHTDDARLPDGSHANLAGGWHDAGDYNKWMHAVGPSLALYGMSSAYLGHRQFFDTIDRDGNGRADLLDEIMWGADWLLRMRNPHSGGLYGSIATGWSYWGLAENETDNIAGNADDRPALNEDQSVSRAAAAFAQIARIMPQDSRYLEAAVQLERYSRKEGLNPDRLLANLAIWQAKGSVEYLDQARACADAIAAGSPDGRQGVALAALALFVEYAPEAKANPKYRVALLDSMTWLTERQAEPFRLAAGRSGLDRDMEQADRFTQWGHHMELTSNAWAAAACAKALGQPELLQVAYNELDWLLGLNPLDLCMLQGAGSHHPARYHHRYSAIPGRRDGAVPGAIPNGIGRPTRFAGARVADVDVPFMDEVNRDPSTDEPWIPYNGFLLCALGEMPGK